jgi:hypothetical protein
MHPPRSFSQTTLALLLGTCVWSGHLLAATSVPPNTAEILDLLQQNYLDYARLQAKPTDNWQDWVRRSQGEIVVEYSLPTSAVVPPPMFIQSLPQGIIYVRGGSFTPPKGWETFMAQARRALAASPGGLVLDLRSNVTPDDFAGAAQVAHLGIADGSPLFTIRDAHDRAEVLVSGDSSRHDAPLCPGPIAILIDQRTAGAAEALVAALQARGAVAIGSETSGHGARFESHLLSSGQTLRYVSGLVTMASGDALWHRAVQPDLGLPVDDKEAEIVLGLIDRGHLTDVIQESPASHRLSEAALVRGEDPELDAYLEPTPKSIQAAAIPQDSVLVAALDGLRALRIAHEGPTHPPTESSVR